MGVTFSGAVNDKKLNYFEQELERLTKEERRAKENLGVRKKRHNKILSGLSLVLVFFNLCLVLLFGQRFTPSLRKHYTDWSRLQAGFYLLISVMVCALVQELTRSIMKVLEERDAKNVDSVAKKKKDIVLSLKEITKSDRVLAILRKYDDNGNHIESSATAAASAKKSQPKSRAAPTPSTAAAPSAAETAAAAAPSGISQLVNRAADVLVGSDRDLVQASMDRLASENQQLRDRLQEYEALLRRHDIPLPGERREREASPRPQQQGERQGPGATEGRGEGPTTQADVQRSGGDAPLTLEEEVEELAEEGEFAEAQHRRGPSGRKKGRKEGKTLTQGKDPETEESKKGK